MKRTMTKLFDADPGKMIITVEGGTITDVSGGPPDLTVEVWDFDTDDTRESAVRNDQGQAFELADWSENR